MIIETEMFSGVVVELSDLLPAETFTGFDIQGNLVMRGKCGSVVIWDGKTQVHKLVVSRDIYDEFKHLETLKKSKDTLSHIDSLLKK